MKWEKETGIDIARYAVRQAMNAGADEAAALFENYQHLFFRFAKNRMIQNMEKNPVTVSIAVSVGKKECTLSLSGTDKQAIKDLAGRCVENARLFFDNEEHLAPVSSQDYRKVQAIDPAILELGPSELANQVNTICSTSEQHGLEAFGTFRKFHGMRSLANSNGAQASHEWTKAGCSITAKTPDGAGSGREEQEAYFLDHLEITEMVDKAMKTATRSQYPTALEPGDYTVIMTPQAAASYLATILFALDARMIEEGRSVFSTHRNSNLTELFSEQLFSPQLMFQSLVDDPRYPVSPFNAAFSFDGMSGQGRSSNLFSDGLPTRNVTFIDQGKICDLFYSYYWARQKNREPVGHPGLIQFKTANEAKSIDQMISTTEKGIYISSFWYIRLVDPNSLLLTGLTRDGTFLIQDGKITRPIKNFRFNESPFVSLQKIREMGHPELKRLWFQQVLMPAMKIDDFTFSSVSDAV